MRRNVTRIVYNARENVNATAITVISDPPPPTSLSGNVFNVTITATCINTLKILTSARQFHFLDGFLFGGSL